MDTQTLTIVLSLAALFVSACGVLVGLVLYVHKGMVWSLSRLHDRLDDMAPKLEVEEEFRSVWSRFDKHDERIRDVEKKTA